MKSLLKISNLLLVSALVLLASCEKEETKAILGTGTPNQLTASATTLVLVQANASNPGVTFTWGKTEYGYSAAVNYTLELSRGGTNFAIPSTTTMNMGNLLTKSFTVGEINAKMQDIIPNGSAQQVQARIRADIGSNVAPVYSNVVDLTVTSYRDLVNYEFPQALRLAGNFQGWSPSTGPKIVDKFASGTTGTGYEGYIYMNDAAPKFKLVKGPDWSAGDFGGGVGTLTNGGSDLAVTGGAGVYYIKANTVAMTWSFEKITTWGIIGSATPNDWGSSTPMVFNAADNTWTLTVNLTGGAGKELKFRANNDWAINFGDNAPADNKPDYGGDNIKIANDGNYTITLDLSLAGNYYYTIRRN